MSDGAYLSERAWLYLPFFSATTLICAVILALPYDTVYVRDRAYLSAFLVIVVICTLIFLFGTLFNILAWMRGKGLVTSAERRLLNLTLRAMRFVLSKSFARATAIFLRDALYLSKLKERSVSRWFMHFMILGGFVLMFFLDLVVTLFLDIVRYEPMILEDGWAKLWIRDFGFEVAGAMLLLGLVIATIRRFGLRPKELRTELPDAVSILFLLAVVFGGFVLEAMGIAGSIPGHEQHTEYSFLGHALALIMPASSGDFYDAAWLVHGVMSAMLIAYIPFSKLFHMIATPIAIELEGLLAREVPA